MKFDMNIIDRVQNKLEKEYIKKMRKKLPFSKKSNLC